MISIDTVPVGSKTFQYIKVEMKKAPLLLLKGSVGYVMCGYLNMEVAEKLGDIAVRVTGVNDLDSLIAATVNDLTSGAAALGIKKGDTISGILSSL